MLRRRSVCAMASVLLVASKRRISGQTAGAKGSGALFANDDGFDITHASAVPGLFGESSGIFIASDNVIASLAEIWSTVESEEWIKTLHDDDTLPSVCAANEAGMSTGCKVYCKCGWGKQCYPRWTTAVDGRDVGGGNGSSNVMNHENNRNSISKSGERVNIGICGTSMSMLTVLSFGVFISALVMFLGLRTLLQWRAFAACREEASLKFQAGIIDPQASLLQVGKHESDNTMAQNNLKVEFEADASFTPGCSDDSQYLSAVPEVDEVDEGWDQVGDPDSTDVVNTDLKEKEVTDH